MTKTRSALLALSVGWLTLAPMPLVFAQDKPNQDIDSAVPEAQEDCDALRKELEARRQDNRLTPQDTQELRDKGC